MMGSISDIIPIAADRALEEGLIESKSQGDFAVDGISYAESSEEKKRELAMIASSRLATLGWLAGKREWGVGGEVGYLNPINALWRAKGD